MVRAIRLTVRMPATTQKNSLHTMGCPDHKAGLIGCDSRNVAADAVLIVGKCQPTLQSLSLHYQNPKIKFLQGAQELQ